MASEKHKLIRSHQIQDGKTFENSNPSDLSVTSAWIFARRKNSGDYPAATENSGKWLVFVPSQNIDEVWYKIKQAIESGVLGNLAKVSSARFARPNSFSNGVVQHVICVYTYDWTDKDDVFRIREKLREIGITEMLSYKSDADTMAGKYSDKGNKNISKYRS